MSNLKTVRLVRKTIGAVDLTQIEGPKGPESCWVCDNLEDGANAGLVAVLLQQECFLAEWVEELCSPHMVDVCAELVRRDV